ncbi:3-phenylpropionate/cinnamic acid dioxygenase subunit beta [Marinomonas primoryensis]|uniref:Nuclear transport factor 2 (NTF2-like) superfamily protein n=1 Tax=Marinomonas primoryensis TaxID=178399 RepID=A0A859D0A5_9GAMM|nr:3-phenylpropionate/cinnamic acid dioxygenase subunit beta [Marinomonas primoryensis]QKK81882.1 Nuclear transport factor 2 (NTF2-like) superfamily protein [Marinomonas primoryensis]
MFYKSEDLTPVSAEEFHHVSMVLSKEYRLLDEERFEDWLSLLHPEIHYWMPGMENRRRENPLEHGFFDSQHMAFFDDTMRDLKRRVARFNQPSAWAENPGTRNVHIVAGVEVFLGENEGEYIVYSTFQSIRSRGLDEEYIFSGRRYDTWLKVEGSLKLKKRLILMPNATLTCKNINTFI